MSYIFVVFIGEVHVSEGMAGVVTHWGHAGQPLHVGDLRPN